MILQAVTRAIAHVVSDFQLASQRYFTEEDVRWRLTQQIETFLAEDGRVDVKLQDDITSTIHGEYPTPFRCSMANRSFALQSVESKAQRGHFDIVLLNPTAATCSTFEIVRAQYYQSFLRELPKLILPFLDYVIELKLYRDLSHPNRTESPDQQAEYAVQAIKKVSAVLAAQPQYYHKPFARNGTVLLFDNSHLTSVDGAKWARSRFLRTFEEALDWNLLPATLFCMWVSPEESREYNGLRPPLALEIPCNQNSHNE